MNKHTGSSFDDLLKEDKICGDSIGKARQRALAESLAEMPAYEADDGPLSPEYVEWLQNKVEAALPKGKVLSHTTLF